MPVEGDEGAHAALGVDKAVLGESLECSSDGSAAYRKLLGEFVLARQECAVAVGPGDDRLAQPAGNLLTLQA